MDGFRICLAPFFIEDLQPEKVYKDGTVRPSNGLFRCMKCGNVVMFDV